MKNTNSQDTNNTTKKMRGKAWRGLIIMLAQLNIICVHNKGTHDFVRTIERYLINNVKRSGPR